MLAIRLGSHTTEPTLPPGSGTTAAHVEADAPVTWPFLKALFASLRDDLQTLKKDLSDDLEEVHPDHDSWEVRVSSSEYHKMSCDEEIEQLQQKII
ncbi:hypothetical protein NDU88_006112 [Pleurodeles waltl]|uniref:Uncharacterized protein n=1 Tax=Pleurodeles waltl TaxID=8319 RepID=A0AAV7N002_PLEWA|nr:hypothetical protein NDU88_006112 [Pleurodeles waltl]